MFANLGYPEIIIVVLVIILIFSGKRMSRLSSNLKDSKTKLKNKSPKKLPPSL